MPSSGDMPEHKYIKFKLLTQRAAIALLSEHTHLRLSGISLFLVARKRYL